jgi:hexosaminidase
MDNGTRISIIPEPASIELLDGFFTLDASTSITCCESLQTLAHYLVDVIRPSSGLAPRISMEDTCSVASPSIMLRLLDGNAVMQELGSEGYKLRIEPMRITIDANAPAGVFYGIQTFRQLLHPAIESRILVKTKAWLVPCVSIIDYPRFSWRGYMIDDGRHFLGKYVVKKLLDVMAFHKLNVFHWHLTEDQGWRIEIKRFPGLTSIGAWRQHFFMPPRGLSLLDKITNPGGGFYTQADVSDIIDYAANRFIRVVPEIEMPGHSRAAIAAYPDLSCTGQHLPVSMRWGIHKDVYCAGKDIVENFIHLVLDEVVTLFPSDIIHVGGDEVPKAKWKDCPRCQKIIKQEGLKDEDALQTRFMNRAIEYLATKGRIAMGWDEILKPGLRADAIGHYWAGKHELLLRELRSGRKIVNSFHNAMYIDYPYWKVPLDTAYAFDPVPPELEPEHQGNVLGLEAPMWGEVTPNVRRLEWYSFPRVCAYAETSWSPRDRKDFGRFMKKLAVHLKRLDIAGVFHATIKEANPGKLGRKPRLERMAIGYFR